MKQKKFLAVAVAIAMLATTATYVTAYDNEPAADTDSVSAEEEAEAEVESVEADIDAAGDTGTYYDFAYKELDDGTLSITKYSGSAERVVVPAEIDGKKVTEIGSGAFRNNGMTSVVLQNGLTTIGNQAFQSCSKLTTLEIPETVTTMGERVFQYCRAITRVTLHEGLTAISDYAFSSCSSIKEINIPSTVTSIGYEAFHNCESITSISIPGSVKSIGTSAFYGCKSLAEVKLSKGLTAIAGKTFGNCSSLTEITIPETVTEWSGETFYYCSALTKATIESPIVGKEAFYHCAKLADVKLANGVTTIREGAFYSCNSLPEITIPGSVETIEKSAFYDCSKLAEVNFTNGAPLTIGNNAFDNCHALTEVKLPASIYSIGDCAFKDCRTLVSVDIPDTVAQMGKQVFINCYALTSLKLPTCVTSLYQYEFSRCTSLTSITLTDSIISINAKALTADYSSYVPPIKTVYYYSGTEEIETFAKDHTDIDFVPIGFVLKDSTTGVRVPVDNGVAPETSKLTVKESNKTATSRVYSVSIVDGSGKPVQLNGTVTVKIPVPYEWYYEETMYVYGLEGDENININPSHIGDYYIHTTDTLGDYVISTVPLNFVIIDETTDVRMVAEDGSIPDSAELVVKALGSTGTRVTYDISILSNGKVVQPDGSVTVKIPVPAGFKGQTIFIYRSEGNDKYTNMRATVEGDYLVFTTDHFSEYIVTTEKLVATIRGDVDNSGEDPNNDDLIALAQYLANWTIEINMEAANVDGDAKGVVNNDDLIMLAQLLAGWQV